MNIEKTQKINRLARELLAHGIAASSQDAVSRAEEMIEGRKAVEQKVAEVVAEKENHEIRLLQGSIRQLSSEFSNLRKSFDSLQKEVAAIKQHSPKPAPAPAPLPAAVPAASNAEGPVADAKKPDSPVSKSFSEDDVAIDKIFYFGQK